MGRLLHAVGAFGALLYSVSAGAVTTNHANRSTVVPP